MLTSCSRRMARRHYSPHNENLERMEAVTVFYQALEFRGWIFHVIADNTFLAGVYEYMEEQIYITSKLREVKRSQFLFEILPVLKRVFSDTQRSRRDCPGQQEGMQFETGENGPNSNIRIPLKIFVE